MASADLMERNLLHRIEVMFPILDKELQLYLKTYIIDNYLKDNTFCWEMDCNGVYHPVPKGNHSAQEYILAHYQSLL